MVSVTQEIDLQGRIGKVVAGLLFGLTEIELGHIRERQAAGIAVAKADGKYRGRKPGATKAKPEKAKELKARGFKSGQIMRELGIRSRSTLSRYLAEEKG